MERTTNQSAVLLPHHDNINCTSQCCSIYPIIKAFDVGDKALEIIHLCLQLLADTNENGTPIQYANYFLVFN